MATEGEEGGADGGEEHGEVVAVPSAEAPDHFLGYSAHRSTGSMGLSSMEWLQRKEESTVATSGLTSLEDKFLDPGPV